MDVGVLVSSCDRYSDLWSPFFKLFFRYWEDCPYPVYLISNFRLYPDSRVKGILVGEDIDWSSNMYSALRQITHPMVILLMEDYLLDRPVDTVRIEELVSYMQKRGAVCMRLFPCPGPETACPDNREVGEILRGADYRLSLQAAIWRRDILLALLRRGETPWELEVMGSRRSDEIDLPFLSVTRDSSPPISYFCTAIVRGYWARGALSLCRREGIEVNLTARECEPWQRYLKRIIWPGLEKKLSFLKDLIGKKALKR